MHQLSRKSTACSTAKHTATATLSTAKHPATATHATNAAAAGNLITAFHKVTAASTAAAATTEDTNTSANAAAASAAAAHTNVTEHRFIITAVCHVTTHYNARH